jgi:Tetrahydrofolate dehydrogenase/cyclohydrolase, catalytic domain
MTAKVIDGKAFAATVRAQVAAHVARLKEENGLTPGLAVVLVGEDPASKVYVKNKHASTIEVGMASFEHRLSADTGEAELLALIDQLNADPAVHGILVQLPLPGHLNSELVINRIDPAKDVDGFHISNVGLLGTGQKSMVPCTPLGCLMVLRDHHGKLAGGQLHGDDCAQPDQGPGRGLSPRRHPGGGGGATRDDHRRDGETGGDGDRCRHQPDRAGRQGEAGGRRALRKRGSGSGGDHTGAGRGWADDDCLSPGQYAHRLLPGERAGRAGGADGIGAL